MKDRAEKGRKRTMKESERNRKEEETVRKERRKKEIGIGTLRRELGSIEENL
jgi:hypothetical protein